MKKLRVPVMVLSISEGKIGLRFNEGHDIEALR